MKWLIGVGVLLLAGCVVSLPNEMSWKDYHVARQGLHVTYNRADVLECKELGAVHGKSRDDVGSAKEQAITAAVLMGADHLLLEQIEADIEAGNSYLRLPMTGGFVHVYGTAYQCGDCPNCIIERRR